MAVCPLCESVKRHAFKIFMPWFLFRQLSDQCKKIQNPDELLVQSQSCDYDVFTGNCGDLLIGFIYRYYLN